MHTKLEDLTLLKSAQLIAGKIWDDVQDWKAFEKRVVGEQITRSADSIGANLAEAYGRFHYGDKLKFLYYSRGSLYETKYWINLSVARKLITTEEAKELAQLLTATAIQINAFASSLRGQKIWSEKVSEQPASYVVDDQTMLAIFTNEELSSISTLESQISLGA